jgi:hypothetical protein
MTLNNETIMIRVIGLMPVFNEILHSVLFFNQYFLKQTQYNIKMSRYNQIRNFFKDLRVLFII